MRDIFSESLNQQNAVPGIVPSLIVTFTGQELHVILHVR